MRRIEVKLAAAILLVSIIVLTFPLTALAAPQNVVVVNNTYLLKTGQTLNDNLYIFGGNVDLQVGSTITGNVLLMGGSIQAAGIIHGNVTVVGGSVNLASTFVLNGNLNTAGSAINRAPGAQINGQVNINGTGTTVVIPGQVPTPSINTTLSPLLKVGGFFLRLFLWALAAMVLAMFVPSYLSRTSQAAVSQPLLSGLMGILTAIVVPIVLILLVLTICLIPVTLLGFLVLIIGWVFGLISLGFELGKRISSISKVEWHPALIAGLGTLLLMTVLNGVEAIIPCIGWIPKILVGLVGLGAVLLTQFGVKSYNPTPRPPASIPEVLPPA